MDIRDPFALSTTQFPFDDFPVKRTHATPAALEIARIRFRNEFNNQLPLPRTLQEAINVYTKYMPSTSEKSCGTKLWAKITNLYPSILLANFCFVRPSAATLLWNLRTKRKTLELDNTLSHLSGSLYWTKAIHAISPYLGPIAQQILINLEWADSIKGIAKHYLNKEEDTIKRLVDLVLTRIYINTAKNIKKTFSKTEKDRCVELEDIIGVFLDIVKAHLPRINARYAVYERVVDPIKREAMLNQLFQPMADDFIVLAFPRKLSEIFVFEPQKLTDSWDQFQNFTLPQLLRSFYKQVHDSHKQDKKQILLSREGGESLVTLAEMLAQKAGELLPTLFDNESNDPLAKPTQLVGLIVKLIAPTLSGSQALVDWVLKWLERQLKGLSLSKLENIQNLWRFIGGFAEPLLLHIFHNITNIPIPKSELNGKAPDVWSTIAIRLFALCSQFFNEHQSTIEESLANLPAGKKELLIEEAPLKHFVPLAESLLTMIGLNNNQDWPLPTFLRDPAIRLLKDFLPRFLLKQYLAITNSRLDDGKARETLRKQVLDPKKLEDPAITVKVVSVLNAKALNSPEKLFEEFFNALWEVSGTENLAQTLEKICAVMASDSVGAFMDRLGVSSQTMLKPEVNAFMKHTLNYLKARFEVIWLEMLVQVIGTTSDNIPQPIKDPTSKEHSRQLLLMHVLQRIFGIVDKGLKNIGGKLQEIEKKQIQDKRVQSQEIRKVFDPLANELQALSGQNPLNRLPFEGLPSSTRLKEQLWAVTRATLLPDLVAATYFESTEWTKQLAKSHDELEQTYHTTHPKWVVHVMAKYASDFTRNYLKTSNKDMADLLVGSLQDYFDSRSDPKGKELKQVFVNQKTSISNVIANNLRALAESKDPQLDTLWPGLNAYIEAFLAKLFARLSTSMREIEAANPDLILDAAINMLKETAEYFKVLNRVNSEFGADNDKVSDIVTLAAFGDQLHDGVPLNPDASEEDKQKVRLQGYFIPLAAKIFELANLTIKDFPIPSTIREVLGEVLVRKLFPQILMHSHLKALEPQVLDSLMLSFVQTLYSALHVIETKPKDAIPEEARKLSAKQRHLNETCGAVVLEIVKTIPDTMVQYVFMKEKVKNMSAEMIGGAVMTYLSRWSILQMIDSIFYSSITNFHPARWEGKVGREKLIPRKACLCPDGKMELKMAKQFKFTFPKNAAEIQTAEENRRISATMTRIQLRDEFTRTISSQLRVKLWDFIKAMWDSLQGHINDFLEGVLPGIGPKIKASLDRVLRPIFFDIIGAFVQFLTAPIINAIQYAIEKVYIDKRADEIIESLHSVTLEHLLYKWTDSIMDALMRHHKPKIV